MQYLNKISIKSICIWGFELRILMLTIVLFFGEDLSTGLLGSTMLNDDVRYIEIAEAYAKSANFVIDVPTFIYTLDSIEIGFFHDGFTALWYWIVCVLYYILRYEVLVKIVNILFAIVSIKCIYDICMEVYGKKVAKLACTLYAFFPYPIIFSCFLYKDQFYTMITLLLIRAALQCAGHIRFKDFAWMAFLVLLSMLTRSGLVVLVVAAVFFIVYKKGNYKLKKSTLIIAIPIMVAVIVFIYSVSRTSIERKLLSYIYEFSMDSGENVISFFIIKSPDQIWKYPLSLSFLLLLPLKLSVTVKCWMDVAGLLNIVSVPLAIGNILYLGIIKMKKNYLYWIFQSFYLITIITSLGIIRHHYYLQPFMMIIFANYYYRTKDKTVLTTSSVVMCVCIIAYWFIQI